MTEQYRPNLGYLCDEDAKRDAVHIAVAPVIAGQELAPGNHVGLVDGKASMETNDFIGIIDPFLTSDVEEGQRCWLYLYPNTVQSLRHVWTHRSFKAKLPERIEP